jgi:TolB-like protein/lipoprotein NlpI
LSFINELKRRNVLRVAAAYVVTAWLVIQVVETIFPVYGLSDASIRIVITMLAIGLVPTLIFTWVFELTPEGLKKETEVDRSQSIAPRTGRRLDRMIMVVLALALGYFAFDKFVLNPQREAAVQEQFAGKVEKARREGRTEAIVESYGDKSIAVLPFVNMSSDAEQEYFSDGISEELLNLLVKIPELRVISRTSAFSFKGREIEISEIAEQLDVAYILEGSVRTVGNRVRITAQLIEAYSDTHMWSETYERQLDDIFAIQDEIAVEVTDQLKITLLGVMRNTQKVNPEAYTLYLQAEYLYNSFIHNFEQPEELYKQALAIEPQFAEAWHGLARNYLNQVNAGVLSSERGFALALEATENILSIDPESAQAQSLLGWIAMRRDSDLSQAAVHFQRAFESNPANEASIRNAANILHLLNRLDESLVLTSELVARDPVNPNIHFGLGITYYRAKRWDDSITAFRTALRLSPDLLMAHFYIGVCLLFKGEVTDALDEMVKEKHEQRRTMGMALVNYSLGRPEKYQASLTELIERWGAEQPRHVARVYAFAKEKDNAFRWLDRAIESKSTGLNRLPLYPLLQNLHFDPRWPSFLHRIGSSPEQLNAIEFEVRLP